MFSRAYLSTPQGILKLIEIVTVLIAFLLCRGAKAMFKVDSNDAQYFGLGVLVTAMIITPLLLVCYLMGRYEIQKTIFEMAFNSLMFIFLVSVGVMTVNVFSQYDYIKGLQPGMQSKSIALGSICIIASFAYLGDAICAVMVYRK